MSFFGGGFECSCIGRMLSLEIHPIGKSYNDDPFPHHSRSNAANDHVSIVLAGDEAATIGGMAHPNAGIATLIGGVTTIEGGLLPSSSVCLNPMEDEIESPLPNPPYNVIDLDSEATTSQVIPCRPFVPPPPLPWKPIKAKKKYPPITLSGYSWVHEEVGSYTSSS